MAEKNKKPQRLKYELVIICLFSTCILVALGVLSNWAIYRNMNITMQIKEDKLLRHFTIQKLSQLADTASLLIDNSASSGTDVGLKSARQHRGSMLMLLSTAREHTKNTVEAEQLKTVDELIQAFYVTGEFWVKSVIEMELASIRPAFAAFDKKSTQLKDLLTRLQQDYRADLVHSLSVTLSTSRKTLYFSMLSSIFVIPLVILLLVRISVDNVKLYKKLEEKIDLQNKSIHTIEEQNKNLNSEIRARTIAEAAVRESEEILRLYLEYTPAATAMCDLEMRYLAYSNRWITDYNLPDESLIGRCHYDVFENIPERWKKQHQRCFKNQVIVNNEEPFTRIDGSVDWVRRSLYPWRNKKGEVGGLIMFTEVITKKKKAENELKRLRNYLGNIVNSMPSVLVGIDTDGRITQWNRQAEQVTGVASDKAQGQLLEYVMPRLRIGMDLIREAIEKREVKRKSKINQPADGGTRYEDVTIFPLIANGIEGAVIRIDDVTEKVRMEEMIIQSEKMLSVGGLAAGMAHEINNPLAGMMQTASVMADRLTQPIAANERAAEAAGTTVAAITAYVEKRGIDRMLDNIKTSGRRAANIVENMLGFARKVDAGFSSHNLAELLDLSIELAATDYDLKKQYDFKRITITREYETDLPPVPCEKQKIQQVFLNILRNGAEAVHLEGDERQPCFILRAVSEADSVRVEIEDNGPGMDEETRRRVFEPFYTTKPQGIGTGLGLSISYFIITENHGGRMFVESAPGKGTKFIITLPRK